MKRALAVALAVFALGALAYGVEYVLLVRAATAPPTPEAFVQAAWTVYRKAPGHRVHVGDENLPCTGCHAPSDDGRFDEPGPGVCVHCHEEQTAIEHGKVALDAHGKRADAGPADRRMTDCLTCHGFGPDPMQKPTDCMRCHVRAKGEQPAVVIHAQEQCTSCHDVHKNEVAPIACADCHDVKTRHGAHDAASAAQCLDCHHAHAPAQNALTRCASCHQGTGAEHPVPASATAGKHTCTGCHAPHAFEKRQVRACTSCHTQQPALAGAGHQSCSACHAPHDVSAPVKAQNVCVGCHRDVELSHPAPVPSVQACTSCHDPHPAARAAGPATCTSCHANIAAGEHAAHAKGMACTGCHRPHDFAAALTSGETCEGCHKPRMAQLANTGHARCASCHEALPHGGMGAEKPCASCHEQQGARVHEGHRVCTQCHDAHTGKRGLQLCASCHGAESAQLSPKHGECKNCHEPHEATPTLAVASCTSCHRVSELPALHQIEEHHAPCQSCHQAHPEDPPGKAATCRGCHTDKRDHQPEATQCNGCHPFEAPPNRRPH